ncbi:MAG: diaminobutyrate acetyltransferase [Paenalcaligenes sp.]
MSDTTTTPIASAEPASPAHTAETDVDIVLRAPSEKDGARIHQLIQACPPLDVNSLYAYLLLATHFSQTSLVAEQQGRLVGFVSAYIPPSKSNVLFVWQVAVHSQCRGQALGLRMLQQLLRRSSLAHIRYVETTVSPDNPASRAMFSRVAKQYCTRINEQAWFEAEHFGQQQHAEEPLLRIGPLPARAAI